MAQLSWLYADDKGSHYNIGLYHGMESGHVMVYCNGSIVVIDFSIRENKSYSFYVGDEFFELGLNKSETDTDNYSYELKINKEVSSPLNIVRNQVNKYYNYICIALAAVFIFAIFLATYLLYHSQF